MYQAVGHVPRLLLAGGTCRRVCVTNESAGDWRHVQSSEGRERSNRHCVVTRRVLAVTRWDIMRQGSLVTSQTSALTMTLLLCGDMMFCSYGKIKYLPESVSVSCFMFKASLQKVPIPWKGYRTQKYTVFLFKYCQLMPFIDIRLQWYKVIDYLGVAKSFCLIKNKWHTICPKPPRHWLSWF